MKHMHINRMLTLYMYMLPQTVQYVSNNKTKHTLCIVQVKLELSLIGFFLVVGQLGGGGSVLRSLMCDTRPSMASFQTQMSRTCQRWTSPSPHFTSNSHRNQYSRCRQYRTMRNPHNLHPTLPLMPTPWVPLPIPHLPSHHHPIQPHCTRCMTSSTLWPSLT